MGRPKLLLPWGGKTILEHLLDEWVALGATQIAVIVESKSALQPHLGRVDKIINPTPEQGMFGSVQCAARWDGWKRGLTHFLITLGDQPHVKSETLQRVIHFAAENPEYICQPARKGRGRHPVVLPRTDFFELATSEEATLKEFLAARQRKMFESDDAGLDLDLDTPEDYERARKLNIERPTSNAEF